MGYRETEEHAMIHRQLIAKAVRLSVRFEENKLDFGEIFNFLANDVVIEHMLKTDRKYFPFLPQARHWPIYIWTDGLSPVNLKVIRVICNC